jgi:hypothetical protein
MASGIAGSRAGAAARPRAAGDVHGAGKLAQALAD